MKIKDTSNAELLHLLVDASFKIVHYPNNKGDHKWFDCVLAEMASRLGLTTEELDRIRDNL